MHMIEMLNGTERTIPQMQKVIEEAGWKLDRVVQGVNFGTQKVIAIPKL